MTLVGDRCGALGGHGDKGQLPAGEKGSHPDAVSPCHEAGSLQLLLEKQNCPARGAELSMVGVWEALPDAGTPHKSRRIN